MDPIDSLERHMTDALTPRELAYIANTDVLGYIQAGNAEAKARAAAEGWQLLMTPCESLADEYTNVYEYLHSGARSEFSDYYKELNGIRPRWVRTSQMTLAQVQDLIAGLDSEYEAKAEQEKEWQAEDHARQVEFERQQAMVQEEYSWEMSDGILYAIQDRLMGF
jgi:hypothetical protein